MLTTLKINKTDSGWPESFVPSSDEIKAYFLGWRLCDADGAPYVSGDKYWHKWTDLSGLTDTCPTTSYVGSERHLAIVASDTPEEVEVDIDTDLRIFSGDNYIGADVPAEIDLSWTEINESIEDRIIAGRKYLVYIEGKSNDTGVLDATLTVTNGVSTITADAWTDADTDYARRFLTFTPETASDWQLKVVFEDVASTPVDYTFRNLDMIDLTNLGKLSAPMQEVFGETNWSDLTDEQLATYFDAVGHIDVVKAVGYTWDAGNRAFSISNYGETLDSTPISTLVVDTELHGWNGVFDAFSNDQKTTYVKRLELQDATIGDIDKLENSTSVEIEEMTASVAFTLDYIGNIVQYMELADTDTGFSGVTPTSDDIKRYFNGWKYVDGTDWSPIGYTGDNVDAATALANLVTDIYDADWRPWNYVYQLDESEMESIYANGALESYPGVNNIVADDALSAGIITHNNPELVSSVIEIIDSVKARIASIKSRIEALEEE